MLAPQVVIHLSGNDALAGELNQLSAPRGSAPEQTRRAQALPSTGSTLHGKANADARRSRLRRGSFAGQLRCRSNRKLCRIAGCHQRWRARKKTTMDKVREAGD